MVSATHIYKTYAKHTILLSSQFSPFSLDMYLLNRLLLFSIERCRVVSDTVEVYLREVDTANRVIIRRLIVDLAVGDIN